MSHRLPSADWPHRKDINVKYLISYDTHSLQFIYTRIHPSCMPYQPAAVSESPTRDPYETRHHTVVVYGMARVLLMVASSPTPGLIRDGHVLPANRPQSTLAYRRPRCFCDRCDTDISPCHLPPPANGSQSYTRSQSDRVWVERGL
jgi:hypothetical protein